MPVAAPGIGVVAGLSFLNAWSEVLMVLILVDKPDMMTVPGNEVIVNVHVGQALIKVRAQPSVRPTHGETVYLTTDPARLHLFGADGYRLHG